MNPLILSLLVSLLITLAAEGLFALVWGVRGKMNYLILLLANTLTNPPVVLTCYFFKGMPLQIALEIAVVAVEGLVFRFATDFKRPFLFALCCNAFSYLVGILIQYIF